MRLIIVAAGAALALAACNSQSTNNADANMAADPNAANMMMTDDNSAMANGAGGADMNTATNAEQESMENKDLHTNDKDTNLSNGM